MGTALGATCGALGMLALGCSGGAKPDAPKSTAPYSFDLQLVGVEIPDEGLEVLYDEEVLGRVKKNAPIVRVTLPHDTYLVDNPGRLRARVEGTCGKQEFLVRIPYGDRQEETQNIRFATGKPAVFDVDRPGAATVYYDNEGGTETVLSVGTRSLRVGAGDRGAASFIIGVCGTARDLFIGGAKVGQVPSADTIAKVGGTAVIVDVVGNRCYRHRTVEYTSEGVRKPDKPPAPTPRDPKKTGVDKPSEAKAVDTVFKGQRVYLVGVVDDFLVAAPSTLAIHNDPKYLTRGEVARCDGRPIVAAAAPAAKPAPAKAPPKQPPRPAAPGKGTAKRR